MKSYIKPIAVMLCIILFCGGLLAVLSDLLFVDESERIQRAINSIYKDTPVQLVETVDVTSVDMTEHNETGVVKACYKLDNDDYLVLSTGKKGYSNGTVTTYVAITKDLEVRQVKQEDYSGQTLMSKLAGLYQRFNGKTASNTLDEVIEVETGATFSAKAASNSVYVALQFVAKVIGG